MLPIKLFFTIYKIYIGNSVTKFQVNRPLVLDKIGLPSFYPNTLTRQVVIHLLNVYIFFYVLYLHHFIQTTLQYQVSHRIYNISLLNRQIPKYYLPDLYLHKILDFTHWNRMRFKKSLTNFETATYINNYR